jgi:glycosyltransferase involved in cell wall biosynthesis
MWSKAKYDFIIANSPETKEKLERLKFCGHTESVPSGIDIDLIDSVKIEKEENTIVYVGRLENYKNIDSLLYAVKKIEHEISGIKIKIIGSGSKDSRLKAIAKKLNLNVEFLGFVDERKKFEIIKSSTLLINPSVVEGLGLIVLEAMACKTPVVIKDLRCYFFCDEKNSVKYGHDADLPKIIADLLTDKLRMKRLSYNGYETSKKFSWDTTAKKIEKIYESL